MAGGLFGTDCASSSYAWLDPGCLLESAGANIGSTVTSALQPVWILLAIAFVFLLVLAFAPNVKHFFPRGILI